MYEQVEKSKENKSRAIANSVAQNKSNVKQGFGFVDNRSESKAQKKLQNIMSNNNLQMMNRNEGTILQRFSVAGSAPSSIDIDTEDGLGGHTRDRHINKSDDYLIERAGTVPEKMASCYTDDQAAVNMTKKGINKNWGTIKSDWAGNALLGARGNVSYQTDKSGANYFYKIFNHKGKGLNVNTIEIWLRRVRDGGGNAVRDQVHVNTSYPTI